MDPEEMIRIDLLTPLSGTFYPDEPDMETPDEWDFYEGDFVKMDGADLAAYQEEIQEMVDKENELGSENGEPCNLMEYFYGSYAINEKVQSAVVSVKEIDGVLYGCTTLQLKEFLDTQQLKELCEYITGQYSDGWGEGFEQRDIAIDGGTLNVHFYQPQDFQFRELSHQETAGMPKPKEKTPSRPQLKLLGHDGNIFSILGDARRLLLRNGQSKEASEMTERVNQSGNYYQALGIISEYVETELSVRRQEKPEKPAKKGREGECR